MEHNNNTLTQYNYFVPKTPIKTAQIINIKNTGQKLVITTGDKNGK
jgi:hypothetical protein